MQRTKIKRKDKFGPSAVIILLHLIWTPVWTWTGPAWPISTCQAAESGFGLTLDQAVDMAEAHSYRLRAAAMDAEGAQRERRSLLADFLPKINANYGYTGLSEQPIMKRGGMEIPTAHTTQYHWDITVTQPLFTGFALTSQYDMAELNTRVKAMEQQQMALDVRRDAKSAFFQLLLTEKIFNVRDRAVEAFRAQEEDSKKFFKQELIPLNDLLRSQVALANALQERKRSAETLKLLETRFNLLIGRPRGTELYLRENEIIPELEMDLETLLSRSLQTRPLLAAGRLGLAVLEKAVTTAKSEYYPQVSAFASYEQNGDDPSADTNDYSNAYNSAVGVRLDWTLFEWGKTRARVSKSRLALKAARQRILALEDQVSLEVEQVYRDLLVARENIKTSEQALLQARENWRITRMQYREQIATSTDVLDARAFLTQADTNYYQALYGYMTALAELERAVGSRSLVLDQNSTTITTRPHRLPGAAPLASNTADSSQIER